MNSQSPTDSVRVGVVGLGWVGQARHIPTLKANPAFKLIGVADRAKSRVDAFRSAPPSVASCVASDIASIDWIDEVEAVSIATAPMAHHRLVCEALALGKHVITEKPFAMSVEDGEQMIGAARAAQKVLAVVHNFQFARSMKKLDLDLQSGRIGRIRGIKAVQFGNPSRRLPAWYQDLPLGLFYDESPHLIYLLAKLAGPLKLAKSIVVPSRDGSATPYQVDAWFRSNIDAPVALSCCFEASISEWYLLVHGDAGVGIVDIFRDIYVRLPNDRAHETRDVLKTSVMASVQHWAQHGTSGIRHMTGKLRYGNDEVFDRFARGIRGDADAIAPIDSESAVRTLQLQHAIIQESEKVMR